MRELQKNKPLQPLKDEDIIPIGKYKKGGVEGGVNGVSMSNVPSNYLLYIYNNGMCSDKRVQEYIENNRQSIEIDTNHKLNDKYY